MGFWEQCVELLALLTGLPSFPLLPVTPPLSVVTCFFPDAVYIPFPHMPRRSRLFLVFFRLVSCFLRRKQYLIPVVTHLPFTSVPLCPYVFSPVSLIVYIFVRCPTSVFLFHFNKPCSSLNSSSLTDTFLIVSSFIPLTS